MEKCRIFQLTVSVAKSDEVEQLLFKICAWQKNEESMNDFIDVGVEIKHIVLFTGDA